MKQFELADRTGVWLGYEVVGNTEIQALLQRALDKAKGRKQDVAKAIGVTPSRFTKLYSQGRGSEAPNVANCLRLATFLGESADVVLRAAKQGDVADLIPTHYGPMRKPTPAPVLAHPIVQAVAAIVERNDAAALTVLRGLIAMADHSARPATGQPSGRARAGRRPA